jgi:flagellar biosynthesis/type III secretory pathway chaperone
VNNALPAVDVSLAHATSTVAALADSLRSEARLLGDLTAIMRRQRESVAHDDLDGVDDSVFSTHRVLVTLQEARRRRRTLNHVLGESDDLSVVALEAFFNGDLPPIVAEAAQALRKGAVELQQEVAMNRRVLREAISAGDRQVQMLVGAASPATGAGELPVTGGRLIDRTV